MMNISKLGQSFKMAIKSILGNKGRSALTMLGIIIGVASVIILTGIGNGATTSITDSLSSLGTKMITVSMSRGGWGGSTRTVSISDMQKFLEENGDIVEAGPGEMIIIPKNSHIHFQSPTTCKYLYVVYPTNWTDYL